MKAPDEVTPRCPNCRSSMLLEAEALARWNGKPYMVRRRRCVCRRYLTTIQAVKNFRGRVKDLPDITGYRGIASVYEANSVLGLAVVISLAGDPETSSPKPGPS